MGWGGGQSWTWLEGQGLRAELRVDRRACLCVTTRGTCLDASVTFRAKARLTGDLGISVGTWVETPGPRNCD